jgi:hypothetical protein
VDRDFEKRLLSELILPGVSKINAGYDRLQMRALLAEYFERKYPMAFFRDQMPSDRADKVIRARVRAEDKAAKFIDANFRNWLDSILLLLFTIGAQAGEIAFVEEAVGDAIPARLRNHNVRGYKKSANRIMNALIDSLGLSKNKGGRRGDDALTIKIENALAELAKSDEEIGQEQIESYLSRITGKQVTIGGARKRLNRKGKTLSGAKGKERKSRKTK